MPRRNQRANRFAGPDLLRYLIIAILIAIVVSIFWNERGKQTDHNNPSEAKPSQNNPAR